MPKVQVFEDLQIWQMARVQCREVFELMEDGRFDLDAPLRDQINGSSGTVMDHIAEGFDRFCKADFRHFLNMARGSNAEVRSQLRRASDRRYLTEEETLRLTETSTQLGTRISSLIHHLESSDGNTGKSGQPSELKEPYASYRVGSEVPFYNLLPAHIVGQ